MLHGPRLSNHDPKRAARSRASAMPKTVLRGFLAVVICCTVALIANQLPTSAADFDVAANADAYTTESAPQRARGDIGKVSVGHDGWSWKKGYFKFDTGSGTPQAVELTLNVMAGLPGRVAVHHTSTEWDEASLTAASAPSVGSLITMANLQGGRQQLTLPLGFAAGPGGEVAVVLVREDKGWTRFASRETETAPRLREASVQSTPLPPPPAAVSPTATTSSTPSATLPASPPPQTSPSVEPSASPTGVRPSAAERPLFPRQVKAPSSGRVYGKGRESHMLRP